MTPGWYRVSAHGVSRIFRVMREIQPGFVRVVGENLDWGTSKGVHTLSLQVLTRWKTRRLHWDDVPASFRASCRRILRLERQMAKDRGITR